MDLGIDRLIEMFEQRFGRPLSTVLLALVGLGVAGLALHSIYDTILVPLADVVVATKSYLAGLKTISLPGAATIIAQIAVGFIAGIVLVITVSIMVRTRKRIDKSFQAIRNCVSELEFENRTLKQEQDALRYFLDRAGGSSGLRLPSPTETGKRR